MASVAIPEEIVVGIYRYRTEWAERLTSPDHVRLNGRCNTSDLVIKIDSSMEDQRILVTAVHELLHAIEDERGLDLEERDVNQLAFGITALLLDNPALTRLFLSGCANETTALS